MLVDLTEKYIKEIKINKEWENIFDEDEYLTLDYGNSKNDFFENIKTNKFIKKEIVYLYQVLLDLKMEV